MAKKDQDQVEKNFADATEHLDKDLVKELEKQNKDALEEKKHLKWLDSEFKKGAQVAVEIHDKTAENGRVSSQEESIQNEKERSAKIDAAQDKVREDNQKNKKDA